MPEEINRIVTDSIADLHFVTEQSGVDHLQKEGIPDEKVYFVGNLMIDALVHFREKAAETGILEAHGLAPRGYVLMTMHRPANVDHAPGLQQLVATIERLTADRPVVFPMHPRTRKQLAAHSLLAEVEGHDNCIILEPLGYLEFLRLMEEAAVVVTDSGGIQEETTFLGVPCLTLRDTTERPVTVEQGTNELLPLDPARVTERVAAVTAQDWTPRRPPKWDGRSAERIRACLKEAL
jgi:UDP-N-acetylglucosamine 2-epimerase (non-hydrolysing)